MMMHDMMNMMGGMSWVLGLLGPLILALVALGIAAFVKYLSFGTRD